MLSDAEKTDARRFLGYPVFGADRAGNMGWRFYQASGAVEYRLNNLSGSEEGVLRGYLTTLGGLERAIPETGAGLDTASAAGWVRNPGELVERERLFDRWRRRLCAFLGVPPGPSLASGSSISLVV
jgi:hypothetical protein